MSVKLYNSSRLSDAALREVLAHAKRLAGAKGKVVVCVGRGTQARGTHGMAHQCSWVRIRGRRVTTRGGYFEISPNLARWADPLAAAESFFRVAIHEFAHIRDYQLDPFRRTFSHAGPSGRRPRHDSRPEEIRAENAVWEAEQRLKRQRARRQRVEDAIIRLGIEMERVKRQI